MNLRYVACPVLTRWTALGIPAQSVIVNSSVGICIRSLLVFLPGSSSGISVPGGPHVTSRQPHPDVRDPTSVESDHRVWNIRFFEQSYFFFGQFDANRG